MLEIEVICRESIKPSTPTPPHLTTFLLSLFDQLFPPTLIPLILYYHHPTTTTTTTNLTQSDIALRLKSSLSQALTLFYPIAGRLEGEISVHCNDEGVDYLEAKILNKPLSHIIKSPQVDELSQLVPDTSSTSINGVQLTIQANYFPCGGIAIGLWISHKICDACSLSTFLKSWAEFAISLSKEGNFKTTNPSFVSSSIFPPKDSLGFKPRPHERLLRPITRRFCFDSSNIAALRAHIQAPTTRVEVVTALLWKCAMVQFSPKSTAFHAVNIRPRMVPPLPDHSFGNLIRTAIATGDSENSISSLVGKLKEAIGDINEESLKKLEGEDGYKVILDKIKKGGVGDPKMGRFVFTSWCRFPFYEVDFGWGEPVWVSSSGRDMQNTIILMDSASGGGMEAWVTMDADDMTKFEQDPQLLAFTSLH